MLNLKSNGLSFVLACSCVRMGELVLCVDSLSGETHSLLVWQRQGGTGGIRALGHRVGLGAECGSHNHLIGDILEERRGFMHLSLRFAVNHRHQLLHHLVN